MTAEFRTPTRIAGALAALLCTLIALVGTPGSAAAAMRAHIERVRGEYEIYAVSV